MTSKILKLNIFLLLLTLPLLTQAAPSALEASRVAGKPDPSCATAPNDPYENPTRISKNSARYVDQCVDTELFRPVEILENTESKIVFANYRHENRYWIAEIQKAPEAIDAVYTQVVRFEVIPGVTAAHVQIRVRMKTDSILLKDQINNEAQSINDIIVSYEAARPKGIAYNFAMGAVDNFVLAGRALSGKQKVADYPGYSIEQYELRLADKNEALDLLLAGLEHSDDIKLSHFYNTVSPNCTTEVFELIDAVPSVMSRHPSPFMTVASGDPIAGPTIEALKERQILKIRFANMKEEIENGETLPPTEEVKPNDSLPLLAEIDGHPYSIVYAIPKGSMTEEQKDALMKSMGKYTYRLSGEILTAVTSASMSGGDASNLLMEALGKISEALTLNLQEWHKSAKDTGPVNMMVYFVPFSGKIGKRYNPLQAMGVRAKLPFPTFMVELDGASNYGLLTSGIDQIAHLPGAEKQKYQFQGLVIQIRLDQPESQVTLQTLGTMKPMLMDQKTENSKVKISKLMIPAVGPAVALTSITRRVNSNDSRVVREKPKMAVDFGAFGRIKGSIDLSRFGQFQILTSPSDCRVQSESVPRLLGKLTSNAVGGLLGWLTGWLTNGKDVSFGIFALDVDLTTQEITGIDVRVDTWPVECKSNDDVNQQFKDALNERVQTAVGEKKSMADSLMEMLSGMISN